jgi:hypothetical protein
VGWSNIAHIVSWIGPEAPGTFWNRETRSSRNDGRGTVYGIQRTLKYIKTMSWREDIRKPYTAPRSAEVWMYRKRPPCDTQSEHVTWHKRKKNKERERERKGEKERQHYMMLDTTCIHSARTQWQSAQESWGPTRRQSDGFELNRPWPDRDIMHLPGPAIVVVSWKRHFSCEVILYAV